MTENSAKESQLVVTASLPRRKNIRMKGWDFTSPGWYFLTICTKGMKSVFGTIVKGRMVLNDAGRTADQFWREIPAHFPRAVVDEYVVMTNHVHGLLQLVERDTACRVPGERTLEAFGKPVAGSVSTMIRSYKSAVTRALGENVWQGRFYEVRARDDTARANIRNYIRFNPQNYEIVMNVGETQYLGNKALLESPKLGFLASRGEASSHGNLPLKAEEVIISGFLSPLERKVFWAALERKRPMIWVKPWGLDLNMDTACRVHIEQAIAAGRLLVLSPFAADIEAPSVRRAAWCNQYTLEHCNRLVIGHLNPEGMLACILAEADPSKEIIYL
jgi:REP element-mobilizing transposase RayT